MSVVALIVALAGCSRSASPPAPAFEPDSIADAYAAPTGALMTPGSTRAWLVTGAGNLYNGAWQLRITLRAGADTASGPHRIAAEDRWMPVLHWARRAGTVRWDFAAVARALPAPRDSALIVSLEIRARNLGPVAVEARTEIALEPRPEGAPFAAWDAASEPPRWSGGAGSDLVHAWSRGAGGGATLVAGQTLGPGEVRIIRCLIPSYPMRAAELAALARRGHATCESEARSEWDREIARGARFELGDPEVERALRGATVVLLSCRERRGMRWIPIGGPFQYRDVWLRDGARAIAALSVAGYTAEARALADGFLLLQWPHGAFLSQRGQLDGNGQALWAFEQALLRPEPPPGAELARFADAAELAGRWLDRQREMGLAIGETFATMLPFANPRDAELTEAQLLGNDAWSIAGLRASTRLLEAAGRAQAAASSRASLERGRADFLAALEASGAPDLPPSWQGVGRDWGSFAAAWPCGAISPGHPRAVAFAERVWRAGGGTGLTFYGTPDSLHGYLGADLGVWAMRTGRRAQADRVLDAHLYWRSASGAAGEIFDRRGDFGANLPPHATAAAALWLLVRNAVVYDDEDTLRLTMGARGAWWRTSRIERAPTRWGLVDLAFSRTEAEAQWTWAPVPVWTALTLPPATRLAGAAPAPLVGAPGARVVLAPPGTHAAQVAIAPEVSP